MSSFLSHDRFPVWLWVNAVVVGPLLKCFSPHSVDHMLTPLFFFIVWASCYCSLLGRTRSRGRCWAASRLSRHPEPSGFAVHGEVDVLDMGTRHDRRFILLYHTHRPQKGPCPFAQAGAETPDTGAVAVMPDPHCCAMTNHLLCNAIWLYTVVVLSCSITLVVLTISLPQFYKIKSTNTNVYKL